MDNNNNNNNSIGFVLYPEQSAFIWKASWISLFAALYALNVGHYDLAIIPGGAFITSLNYWRNPLFFSWRRKVDISYILFALVYQSIRAYNAEYANLHYFTMFLGASCYPISYHYYYKKQYWHSTYAHSCVHIISNIANMILYSGYVLPMSSSLFGSTYCCWKSPVLGPNILTIRGNRSTPSMSSSF